MKISYRSFILFLNLMIYSLLIIFEIKELSIWSQIVLGFIIFAIWPSLITFLISSLIIGTRQFALVILMHDGAHNLISKNKKINDFISQWLCAFPMMTETDTYRTYHLKHHKHTETDLDPDKILTDPFPVSRLSLIHI